MSSKNVTRVGPDHGSSFVGKSHTCSNSVPNPQKGFRVWNCEEGALRRARADPAGLARRRLGTLRWRAVRRLRARSQRRDRCPGSLCYHANPGHRRQRLSQRTPVRAETFANAQKTRSKPESHRAPIVPIRRPARSAGAAPVLALSPESHSTSRALPPATPAHATAAGPVVPRLPAHPDAVADRDTARGGRDVDGLQ